MFLVVVGFLVVSSAACSGGDDADVRVLSLDPGATPNTPAAAAGQSDGSATDADSIDDFVTEAVADANEAEDRLVVTPTATLLPRRPAGTTATEDTAVTTPTPTVQPPTSEPNPTRFDATPTAEESRSTPTPQGVLLTARPAACSSNFERVYEAFATDAPPIGIAICVASDGRAEYLGIDLATNNRIRLSACVEGDDFVANNGGSVYVVDIATNTIQYPQSPGGRHLDSVTMITSAETIPALGC